MLPCALFGKDRRLMRPRREGMMRLLLAGVRLRRAAADLRTINSGSISMAFPVRVGMSTAEFKQEILEYYFPVLCNGVDGSFADDYAAIGAFLTRKDDVLAKLVPLETKLRQLALEKINQPVNNLAQPDPLKPSNIYDVKAVTKKLLTRALEDLETQSGFNQAKIGMLHDNASFGTGSGAQIQMTHDGRTTKGKREGANEVNLPKGVPKLIGSIAPMDFMILLKHGYAFKDLAAESGHGEFTHRLQWYAIIRAKGELKLSHEPIDLYKKMWFTATKGTQNIPTNLGLYMWVALLDNLTNENEANTNFKTVAWTSGTFNSPENMTTALTRKDYSESAKFKINDPANLYVLRKLLTARQGKRAMGGYDGGSDKYQLKKLVNGPGNKTVVSANHAVGATSVKDIKHAVVWIDSL
jgi:hypothetical protein